MQWTEARLQELQSLAALGMSASKISKKLGNTSRSAVCAIASRKGIRLLGAIANKKRVFHVLFEYQPKRYGISLLHAKPNQCRWIINMTPGTIATCCGSPTHNQSSWCPHHYKIVYPKG